MFKVEECFGCSLRHGSFYLLSIGLILNCIGIWNYFFSLFVTNDASAGVPVYFYWYLISTHIIGVVAFSQGIYGIFKNLPQHLNGSYYYLCYTALFGCFLIVWAIIQPSALVKFRSTKSNFLNNLILNNTPVIIMSYLFGIALTTYCAVVIKSLRDAMAKQKSTDTDFQISTYSFIPLELPTYLTKL